MTTVVTGGAGFLGRRVVARLLAGDADVVSLDVAPRSGGAPKPGLRELRVDVTSFDEVIAAFGAVRPDRVIHLAYLLNSETAPHYAYRLNIGGTDNVLEAARLFDVRRVVIASSLGVHGAQSHHGDRAVTEADICFGDNQYGRHKIFAEWQALDYVEKYGMSVTALRPGHVTGPDKVLGSVDHVRCITEPARGHPVRFPFGDQMRCAIHVDEVAEIFTTLVLTERPRHHVYNTGGTAISLREIAELVRKAIPGASICFDSAEGARASAGTYLIDNTRLLDEFGFAYRPYVDQVQSIIDAVRASEGAA
jgi:nucleoside-diphosphate-sugar epimerase